VVSALTSAARNGVLIKGGEHLEALGSLRALAIDKTGTLTKGALRVADFQTNGTPPDQLLQRITSLEARSEHPIAQAIVRYAEARGIGPEPRVEAFAAVPGHGVRGRVRGIDLVIGTESLVHPRVVQEWGAPEPGALSIYVEAGDGAHGAFTLEDQIRASAADVVRRLHRLGVRPIVMLTGDAAAAAQVIAAAAGVDEARWRLLPEQKVETVRELRTRFGTVGMLGDGVNDAPALAAANVGLAMGAAGSPATIETADVALMGDDLAKLPYAVRLARQARWTIRFNIALALALKLVLAVGAIAGLVSLAVAVLVGDMGGSLAVTGNALRLARMRSAG
jgi:Cd2+/Zn2+-exporting ATPase